MHYNGWNKAYVCCNKIASLLLSDKRWDEWVPESRILKLNEAGLEKQKSLQLETLAE